MAILALLFLVILLPISGFMVYRKIRRKMNEQLLRDALNGKGQKLKIFINSHFLAVDGRVINLCPDNFEAVINDYTDAPEISHDTSLQEDENPLMFLRVQFNDIFLLIEVSIDD